MRKIKDYRLPKKSRARLSLSNFGGGLCGDVNERILPLNSSVKTYNFSLADGGLKDGVGIAPISLLAQNTRKTLVLSSVSPLKLYFYRRYDMQSEEIDDRLLVYCNDGNIYENRLQTLSGSFSVIPDLNFDSAPQGLRYKYNGEDVMIFSCGNQLSVYNGEEVMIVGNVPDITSTCIHYERLFATTAKESTTLWFSDDFDPTNWNVSLTEAGFIDLQDERGKLLKVVSFLDSLYIFREYGITRLSAYGEQANYTVHQLWTASGKINGESVTVCGDRIVFLAADGFYQFDGVYATRIMTGLDAFISGADNSQAQGVFFNGKLYALINVKIETEYERAVLVYDVSGKQFYITRGINATDIAMINSTEQKAAIIVNNDGRIGEFCRDCSIFGVALEKLWKTPPSDLGLPSCRKTVREISLRTKGTVEVKVETEYESRVFIVGAGYNKIATDVSGEIFSFEFKSQTVGAEISKPTLVVEY